MHEAALKRSGVRFRLVQELGDAWTLRFGPLSAAEISLALRSFCTEGDEPERRGSQVLHARIQRTITFLMSTRIGRGDLESSARPFEIT
jgi:hypothetical protein